MSSLTMNEKFQYRTRRPRAASWGIENFGFIVSERVQVNPDNSRAMRAMNNNYGYTQWTMRRKSDLS